MGGVEVVCARCKAVLLVVFGVISNPFICRRCRAPRPTLVPK